MPGWEDLDEHCRTLILQNCGSRDIARLQAAFKDAGRTCRDPLLWGHRLREDYGLQLKVWVWVCHSRAPVAAPAACPCCTSCLLSAPQGLTAPTLPGSAAKVRGGSRLRARAPTHE